MNCDRCSGNGPVSYWDVDGFAYYLCMACAEDWDAVHQASRALDSADRSAAQ